MFWSGQRALVTCARLLRIPRADFSSIPDIVGLKLVRSVDKVIDKSSSIFVESPIHVRVLPLDGSSQSNEQLVIQLYSKEHSPGDFNVKQTSKRLELVNTACPPDRSDVCVLRVPLNLSVHVIATKDACVDLQNVMAEDVIINTQKGEVHIGDVRAKNIKVESSEGSLRGAGRLEACEIDLKTAVSSGIECNNIMSNDLKVTTHAGPISVNSVYSDVSHFTTALGNIQLQHVHRSCIVDVIQNGMLQIGGLEGSLQASLYSGDVVLHVSKLANKSTIFIHEKGNVDLKIFELLKKTTLNLIGQRIDIAEEIKKLGRYMDDSHPQRFRFPIDEDGAELSNNEASELTVECRNGVIELKRSEIPFMLKSSMTQHSI